MKNYKVLLFMKRRPDITFDEFQAYYENHHAPLCQKYLKGVKRYIRRYTTPQIHPENGAGDDLGFDVITELWFDDESVFKGTIDYLSTAIMPDEIIEDERKLFDRSSFRIATAIEIESVIECK